MKDRASIQKLKAKFTYDVRCYMAREADWEQDYTIWTPGS